MNSIVEDSTLKYEYWSKVEDIEFSKFVSTSPTSVYSTPDLLISNVDVDDSDIEDSIDEDTESNDRDDHGIVEPPKLSTRERKRRKRIRYKLKKMKAVEEERMLNEVTINNGRCLLWAIFPILPVVSLFSSTIRSSMLRVDKAYCNHELGFNVSISFL